MSGMMMTLLLRLPMLIHPKKTTFLDTIWTFLAKNKGIILVIVLVLLNIGVFVYFGFATNYFVKYTCSSVNCDLGWCHGYGFLILLMVFIYAGLFYFQVVKRFWGQRISKSAINPFTNLVQHLFSSRYVRVGAALVVLAAFATYLVFETSDNRNRLRGLIGIAVLLGLGFIFSKHPSYINWRPIVVGMILQFLLGIFCIRWDVGRSIFDCMGHKVSTFLNYATDGAQFVYGDFLIKEGVFAFTVLTVIFFFSFMISILYYLGVMQFVVLKLGWLLQVCLGTTVCESVNAAGNIFLGQSESPLLIRPYLKKLTYSEMHSIMTSGFATVSGSVLAAYISFGANPAYLITATVMAAPGSLCYSKLFYPETEKSETRSDNIVMEKSEDTSILDAATNGAVTAIALVLGITANLIAFVAFIAFINGLLGFFGHLVGAENISLEMIFGKIFLPLAWIIGVPNEDCDRIGQIIGIKTVVNEFVAYKALGDAITEGQLNPDIALNPRSIVICTFAICGFANPSSLGIMIGAMGALAPERRSTITSVAIRAFISGTCVCFITASIAGILLADNMVSDLDIGNSTRSTLI
uniref:Sodium/nucleoside cotransporter n=2 Tax=Nyssomyia neivai TaxID=330878 RepID=A0A1L8DEH6_9DIPT